MCMMKRLSLTTHTLAPLTLDRHGHLSAVVFREAEVKYI